MRRWRLRSARRRGLRIVSPPWWYSLLCWATRNQDRGISAAPFFFAGVVLLLLVAWVRPIDHEEAQYQYIAAVALTSELLPYREFAYLQTPFHPLLFGPLGVLVAGHLWEALRVVNALISATFLWFVYRSQRELGIARDKALVATVLLGACDSLLFGAATARNDLLPALFESLGIWILIRSYARPKAAAARSSFLLGLLMSAAAASRIPYVLPLAAVMPILVLDRLWELRRLRWSWFAAGTLVAAFPVVALAVLYPEGLSLGVLQIPAAAPSLWYETAGQGWKLGLSADAFDMVKFVALGPALVAIWIVARPFRASYKGAWRANPIPTYLHLLLAAGLIAAILPTPTWRQFLIPLLPPLFIRLGMILEEDRPSKRLMIALLVAGIAGLGPSLLALASPDRMERALTGFASSSDDRRITAPESRPVIYMRDRRCPAAPPATLPRFDCTPKSRS